VPEWDRERSLAHWWGEVLGVLAYAGPDSIGQGVKWWQRQGRLQWGVPWPRREEISRVKEYRDRAA
jgi:hypothetical protein